MPDLDLDVLVVDDDDVTAESVSRALARLAVPVRFRVVAAVDGLDALAVMRGQADRRLKRPFIVLLDLNMPRMNGFEFLAEVRQDAALREAVIFVLSTSDSDADRSRAYHELIAGYMVKSAIGPQFVRLAAMLSEFARAVQLP